MTIVLYFQVPHSGFRRFLSVCSSYLVPLYDMGVVEAHSYDVRASVLKVFPERPLHLDSNFRLFDVFFLCSGRT